jgi:DNA-binding transcriptional LysR family regulator
LLRRAGRNVELTAAGHRLAAHAEQALAADEAVRTELAALAGVPSGQIRMTFVQTPAIALLPGTLERLATSAPQVEIDVIQRETAPALEELRSHAVDLVVGIEYDPLPVGRRREDHREDLIREDVLLTLHRGHPAAAQPGPVHLTDLQDATWATGHPGTSIDAFLRNACNRMAGYEPNIRHRSDDATVLTAIVGSGRAVALLPALFATGTPGVTSRPAQEGKLQRTIFTAARRTARDAPAILAVRHALRQTATQVAASHDGIELLSVPPATQGTGP